MDRLTDLVSLGVLVTSVPRDAVDAAVVVTGRGAKRSDGKLPPHVMVYFAMAMALFGDADYEEVAVWLTEALGAWGCWDGAWSVPTSGGITQARARLGFEPVKELFERVAVPVAGELTRGAFWGRWRLMAIDGFEWDAADTARNAAGFGYAGSVDHGSPFPKVRVVTISECASHAVVAAAMDGTGVGEQILARQLWSRLEPAWLLIADRNFLNWADWHAASTGGTHLVWRARSNHQFPVLESLPDGSYRSVMVNPRIHNQKTRARVVRAAATGHDLDPEQAVTVRVVEYTVPDRNGTGEVIRLVTTITDPTHASATALAQAYQQRWEHETGNNQLKTYLRGPAKVLRSQSPDMLRQEIYGYLLTHYAISTLICHAATQADVDPDRVKFLRTVRIARRRVTDQAAFPP